MNAITTVLIQGLILKIVELITQFIVLYLAIKLAGRSLLKDFYSNKYNNK